METYHFSPPPRAKEGGVRLRVALVYPNSYAVGMDNLGFQGVFRLLASSTSVHCERVFYERDRRCISLESHLRLNEFDVVAFSISFENDYINVLRMLKDSAIEPLASNRDERSPLLLAGGAATTINPEPMTPFMDAIFLGEADEAIQEIVGRCSELEERGRQPVLKSLALVEGVYVPSIQSPFLGEGRDVAGTVRRRVVRDPSTTFCSTAVSSPRSHLGGMFLAEAVRGCSRKCRFCAATCIYAPLRYVPADSLLARVWQAGSSVRTVGLVGACVSEHPDLVPVARALVERGIRVSVSSLRADIGASEILELLARSGTRTVTIAPEAGTREMRKLVNKELAEDSLEETVAAARDSGLASLRLYFMVGLPGEKLEDVMAIVSLVESVSSRFRAGKKARHVTVSVSPFVPKAWTPFQWCPMDERGALRTKMQTLSRQLSRLKGVRFKPQGLRSSFLQAALSRGSWKTGLALHAMVFEGLSARTAWKRAGLEFDSEVFSARELGAALAWDHLDVVPSRERLRKEYEKAFGGGPG
ncbi:MAG: radical SAM protein [Candidatus Eiseniibacteriota bacterium]|nr:MAG: radical SAM protein [Candidatus Eisenbacteria bacterium]